MKSMLKGAAIAGLATLLIGCNTNSGGEYNRTVKIPTECKEILGAGFSTTMSQSFQANYDWISCRDGQNITVYRINRTDEKWYKTDMVR